MTVQRGFVANYTPIVVDQTGKQQSAQWAWNRFREGFTLQFETSVWSPQRTWEAEGAMSCGITFRDAANQPVVGMDVAIGWPGVSIDAKTDGNGWIDVPTSGGNYAGGAAGPMWIQTKDGTLRYEGIGWRDATNHAHLNLDVKRGSGSAPPVDPPTNPPPGDPAKMTYIRQKAEQAKALLDDIIAATQ
jgi:hypothetical protein